MKRKLALISIAFVIFCLSAVCAGAEESSGTEFILREAGGEYVLAVYESGEERGVLVTDEFSAVLGYAASAPRASITALNVTVREDVTFFAQDLTLSGEITVARGGSVSVLGGRVALDGLVLNIYGSALELKGGQLVMTGGQISSYDSPAVSMAYSALASFDMQGGIISSYGASSTLSLKLGTAIIRGGRIDSAGECGVYSDGNLILSASPKITGTEYDVITTRPITLSYSANDFFGGITVKYDAEFPCGKITPVLYSATAENVGRIRLYDSADNAMPLRFFAAHSSLAGENAGAVYLPFFVDFHDTDGVIYRKEILDGECVTPKNPPERTGYEFVCWRLENSSPFDFQTKITSDLTLYSCYELVAPTFTISPMEFAFDGREHSLQPSLPDHPLIADAVLEYSWLRDGADLNCASASLPLKSVSDSGDYQCKITLTVGADSITVISKTVSVIINPASVAIPTVAHKEYDGDYQSPDLAPSEIYEAAACSEKDAGVYYVTLTLTDAENYEFAGGGSTALVAFEILPRPITVKLSDSHRYLFSSPTAPTFSVTDGEVLPGEELNITFIYDGDRVLCRHENPNYALTVIEGRIIKHATLGKGDLFITFGTLLVILMLVLLVFVLFLRRREIQHHFSILKCKLAPVSHFEPENFENTHGADLAAPPKTEAAPAMAVDAARADELISDSMAKSLLHRGREVVESDGRKKSIINVDTLNCKFSAGDTVDVNKLKNAQLIPYDTAYIKVLARGIIDKPLKVYANDFSLCAVKMLALAGGEAVRVVTVGKKVKRNTREKKQKILEKFEKVC